MAVIMVALNFPQSSQQPRQTHEYELIVKLMIIICAVILPTSAVVRSGGEDEAAEITTKVVCQGGQLKIRCVNSSYGLDIISASYGRTQSGNIVCPYSGSENDFYYNCGERDITDQVEKICKRKKKCSFNVDKELFGDPCKGNAYLNLIYTCVKKTKKKNKKKNRKPSPTKYNNNTTHINNTTNTTHLITTKPTNLTSTIPPEYGINSSGNSTLINNVHIIVSAKRDASPGILISIIVWLIHVKSNGRSFLIVFLITFGSAAFCFLVTFCLIILHKRLKKKRNRKKQQGNPEAQIQKLNTISSTNCDVKKNSDLDTLSNTFPAPPPVLPPPPDDIMYPSPSPDMVNSSRPPPPPIPKGCSLDDISKIGQDTRKHVPVTRSISLRAARPTDYHLKALNFDKLPNIDNPADIQTVIIQRNNGSTMYMNPMYENGHMKEVTC